MNYSESEIRKYFLEDLAADKTKEIDIRIITDGEFASALESFETDLQEDYLEGRLSAKETKHFEENYLYSEERRKRFEILRRLKIFAKEQSSDDKSDDGFIERVGALFGLRNLAYGFSGIALFAVVGTIGYLVWSGSSTDAEILTALNRSTKDGRPSLSRITGFDYAEKREGTRGAIETLGLEFQTAKAKALETVLKNPGAASHNSLGKVFLVERDFDKAINQFELAMKFNDKNSRSYSDLGAALVEKGLSEKSLHDSKPPGSVSSVDSYLLTLSRAKESIEKSIVLDESLLEAHFNRAITAEAMGLNAEAIKAWENYLKFDAKSRWATEARQRLERLKTAPRAGKTKDDVLKEFLSARMANDDVAAWAVLSKNRGLSSGKLIPQQLAFLFVDQSTIGDEIQSAETLAALRYVGELEKKNSGDLYWKSLADYYSNVSPAKMSLLKNAKEIFFGAVWERGSPISKAEYSVAAERLTQARLLYLAQGNEFEVLLIDFYLGYLLNRETKYTESNAVLNGMLATAKAKNYKWIAAQALTWLAGNDIAERRFTLSQKKTEEALKLATETSDLAGIQRNLSQLSELHAVTGQHKKAINALQKNLEMTAMPETSSAEHWRTLKALAYQFSKIERFHTATSYESEALAVAVSSGEKTFRFTSLIDLGTAIANLGDVGLAEKYVAEGAKLAEEFNDPEFRKKCLAHVDLQMGFLNRQKNELGVAIEHFAKAAEYYEKGNLRVFSYEAQRGLLEAAFRSKNSAVFEERLPQVLQLFREYRREIQDEERRNSFFDGGQNVYDLATAFEFQNGNYTMALDYSEESRARSLLDLQNALPTVSLQNNQPVVRLSEVSSQPLKLDELRPGLSADVQILVYSVLSDRVLIWLVTRENVAAAESIIDSWVVDEEVQKYAEILASPKDPAELEGISKRLFKTLVEPIESKLEKAKQLIIVPDKSVFRVPFAALNGKRRLLDDFEIIYAPSINVFLNSTRRAEELSHHSPESLLAVGNPRFDLSHYEGQLEDLPSAYLEAREVGNSYQNATLLMGVDATKEAITEKLSSADVFHFAGHYITNPTSPLLSAFVTAGDSKSVSELANFELIGTKLPKTRLIVLSACDTGLEQLYRGEGVIGAARTFLATGVPLVVASRWKVDSEATRDLMTRFHQIRTSEKLSVSTALRKAQLEMSRTERFSHPYFWAGFATIGGRSKF